MGLIIMKLMDTVMGVVINTILTFAILNMLKKIYQAYDEIGHVSVVMTEKYANANFLDYKMTSHR